MTVIVTIYLYDETPIIIAMNNIEHDMLRHNDYVETVKERVRQLCIDRLLATREQIRYVSLRPINFVDNMAIVQ